MIIPSALSDLPTNGSSEVITVMDYDPFRLKQKFNNESASEGEAVLDLIPVDSNQVNGEEFEGASDPRSVKLKSVKSLNMYVSLRVASHRRFLFGGGGYGCSCKQHKLCLKKAKKKCCCKDGYFALEDVLYQLIIVALLGLLIFFQATGRRRKRRRRSLQFLHGHQGQPHNRSKVSHDERSRHDTCMLQKKCSRFVSSPDP